MTEKEFYKELMKKKIADEEGLLKEIHESAQRNEKKVSFLSAHKKQIAAVLVICFIAGGYVFVKSNVKYKFGEINETLIKNKNSDSVYTATLPATQETTEDTINVDTTVNARVAELKDGKIYLEVTSALRGNMKTGDKFTLPQTDADVEQGQEYLFILNVLESPDGEIKKIEKVACFNSPALKSGNVGKRK